jgi:hypothetical protein
MRRKEAIWRPRQTVRRSRTDGRGLARDEGGGAGRPVPVAATERCGGQLHEVACAGATDGGVRRDRGGRQGTGAGRHAGA